jgi:hypothetical protein
LGNPVARGLAVVGLCLLAACVSPAHRWRQRVHQAGFTLAVTSGRPFRHVVLEKPEAPSRVLHVYLDGDGTPWEGRAPAADPTPRDTLVLELMRLDDRPSLYLGRPCYHGLDDAGCGTPLWTSERYSDAVVSSMATALRPHLRAANADRVVLIGYSGGGALAMLLAARVAETLAVVTVAGNLDTDAWTAHHRYVRLTGSLNPAAQPPLPPRLHQRHYVGTRDRVVPPSILDGAVESATVVRVPGFDHVCCWTRIWPSILADLARVTDAL